MELPLAGLARGALLLGPAGAGLSSALWTQGDCIWSALPCGGGMGSLFLFLRIPPFWATDTSAAGSPSLSVGTWLEGPPKCGEGVTRGRDLGQAPLGMVWCIPRVSPPPSTCHLLAGNTLSLLQGAQCIWHKQAGRGSPPQLAYKKAAVSAGGNWEAREATQCGLQVYGVRSQVPLGGIPAAVLTFTSLSLFPHLQDGFVVT